MGKKRLVRSLKTEDIRLARIARWGALEELKREIANAGGRPTGGDHQGIAAEALAYREEFTRASAQRRDDILFAITERAEEIDRGDSVPLRGEHDEEELEETTSRGSQFAKIASGQATPVDYYLERWLAASSYSERTKADARTAMSQFKLWCSQTDRTIFIETVSDHIASDFRDEAFVATNTHAHTANKKLSALRQYWQWLDKSFGVRPNPWSGKSLAKLKAHRFMQDGPQGSERPFTDDEVQLLLSSDADQDLKDFMPIAALSGMRLEEIGQLRVRDCYDGMFSVTRGKTAAAIRTIPIHSALRTLRLLRRYESGSSR
jgi:hypothetical protein